MSLLQFPLAKFTAAFIGGILIADFILASVEQLLIAAGTALFLSVILFSYARRHLMQKIYFGLAISLVSAILGILTVTLNDDRQRFDHYLNYVHDENSVDLVLVIRDRLNNTKSNSRYIAEVKRVADKESSGLILLNIRRDSLTANYVSGSVVHLWSTISKHRPPLNPHQFDYGKYLQRKDIHAQVFTDPNAISKWPRTQKDIRHYADRLRTRILANLNRSGFGTDELSVLGALILGQRQEISPEINRDYRLAGAIHILSVSGLHVGIVLLIMNFLLKPLPASPAASLIKLMIIIGSLWTFAILASLSPSVVRAVTMFSIVAIGMHINRSTNIFHTLIVSMLIILMYQPSFIYDVGFQLSYIALFGILWLQPLLRNLWDPKSKIVRYFWDIFTVSVAAQTAAFPISIYYFHQFPGLFFVTNLIIIPFLGVIMAYGIAIMCWAIFTTVPDHLVIGLETCISLMNRAIKHIASAEQFIINDIPMNIWMLCILYLCIITGIGYLQKPKYIRAVLMLISAILFTAGQLVISWHNHDVKHWMTFHLSKKTAIVNRHGNRLEISSDKELSEWDEKLIQ
nr:ComEC family competence protein [Flavobacterium sp.]